MDRFANASPKVICLQQMSITAKTRKILWSRSGGRCAICRRALVVDGAAVGIDAVIGEECHIVARESGAARGNHPIPFDKRDAPDNLILLCRNHHKEVDDQPNIYTVEFLREIKARHETWVQESLQTKRQEKSEFFYVFRIDSGTQLCRSVIPSDGYHLTNDQPETDHEAELIGALAQDIQDYSDLWSAIEARGQVTAQFEFNRQIQQLNKAGFLVYAVEKSHRFSYGSSEDSFLMAIAYVFVVRKTNPIIERKDEEIEQFMRVSGQEESEFTNFIPVLHSASSIRFV